MKWCDYSGETEYDFIFGEETIMKKISKKENEAIKTKVVFLLGGAVDLAKRIGIGHRLGTAVHNLDTE